MTAFNRLLHTIESKIAGRLAIGYHRTQDDNLPYIEEKGIMPSTTGLYGPGIYMTYSLNQQLKLQMRKYGPVILKLRVNLNGFLFFDEDVGKKVFGPKYSLKSVLVPKIMTDVEFNYLKRDLKPDDLSSVMAAKVMAEENYRDKVHKHFKGIEYVGAQDGECLLVFKSDPLVVRPLAYVYSDDINTYTSPDDIDWNEVNVKQQVSLPNRLRKKAIELLKQEGFKQSSKQPLDQDGNILLHKTLKGHFIVAKVSYQEGTVKISYEVVFEQGSMFPETISISSPKDTALLRFNAMTEHRLQTILARAQYCIPYVKEVIKFLKKKDIAYGITSSSIQFDYNDDMIGIYFASYKDSSDVVLRVSDEDGDTSTAFPKSDMANVATNVKTLMTSLFRRLHKGGK